MIRHSFYIEPYQWRVTAFFEVGPENAEELLLNLRRTHAPLNYVKATAVNLMRGRLNNGVTYTSYRNRETIMIIGKASSGAEFFNSLLHELKHLEVQTSDAMGIDYRSEEAAYFRGGVAREIYPYISSLLCDCCRSKH